MFLGIDVGAATAKALLFDKDAIVACHVIPTGPDVIKVANLALETVVGRAGIRNADIKCAVATGYARNSIDFADKTVTEIACHAKGASYLFPEARMVIDIGGQDSKAIILEPGGVVSNFVMNDKCAAGTGRFFEVMANVLELDLNKMGEISLQNRKICKISNICTVFAESEVISLRAQKETVEDILAGIHRASAKRLRAMVGGIGIAKPIVFSGGVGKNIGMKKALEEEFHADLIVPEDPQIVGALGAALIAAST